MGAMTRCDFCGAPGGMDMTIPPLAFYKQGRRSQGAMTPMWAPAEWSPTLGAIVCPPCFKPRFYSGKESKA